MIGVVFAGDASLLRVLGLAIGHRAALALQSAGAERVVFAGPNAEKLRTRLVSDDRCRIPLRVESRWPEGGALVVGDGVVVDSRAMKDLAAAADLSSITDERGPLAVLTNAAGDGWPTTAEGLSKREASGVIIRATNARERTNATNALLASLRKTQDGWISRRLNRHISLAITRGLVWLPIRPNALTALILAIGLAGARCASIGDRAWLAMGGVLFQLQSILDGCDGELSRLTFRGSKLGEWLDTIGDDVTNYAFFGGAAWGLHRAGLGVVPLAIGGIGLVAGMFASGIEYAYLVKIGSGDLLKYPLGFGSDPEPTESTGLGARVLGAIRPAFKRDFFVFLAMVMACAGYVTTLFMLVLFAGGAIATLGAVLASEIRRRR